jgi:hypothetical protein
VLHLLVPGIDATVLLGLKDDSTTLSVDLVPSYYFDRKGRLLGGHTGERTYRRTWDNRVIAKWSESAAIAPAVARALAASDAPLANKWRLRQRRELPADAAQQFVAQAHGLAVRTLAGLESGDAEVTDASPGPGDSVDSALERLRGIAAHDFTALAADGQQFRSLYSPIGILPPDQYMALVLQATHGCSWNRCTFCTFYRGSTFRIRRPTEFHEHAAAVRTFHGPALGLFKSIFLADANALIIPQRLLLPLMDVVNDRFDIEPTELAPAARRRWRREHPRSFDGVYSFVSALDALNKTPADFGDLRTRGLRRVYIGLETGDPALLRALNKPNTPGEAVDAVRVIRAGGVHVGVVVMLGIGGANYAAQHVTGTVEAVNAMGLGPDDIVYFSQLVDPPDAPYGDWADAHSARPLRREEIWMQEAAMRAGFRFPAGRPKLSVYDIREFAY